MCWLFPTRRCGKRSRPTWCPWQTSHTSVNTVKPRKHLSSWCPWSSLTSGGRIHQMTTRGALGPPIASHSHCRTVSWFLCRRAFWPSTTLRRSFLPRISLFHHLTHRSLHLLVFAPWWRHSFWGLRFPPALLEVSRHPHTCLDRSDSRPYSWFY